MRLIPPPCPVCLAEPPGVLADLELDAGFAWWHCCALSGPAAWARLDSAAPSPQLIGGRPVYAARGSAYRPGKTSSAPSWRLQLAAALQGVIVGAVVLGACFGSALGLMYVLTGR